ncbi:MAG: hypothetical protein KJ072_10145 [Verrucomicrobia bacterium]|nr:hypothetical protein [Verrucomicrobiota bacterium]
MKPARLPRKFDGYSPSLELAESGAGQWPADRRLCGTVNVALFDGHGELVKLDRLWRLYWHFDYQPPASGPGCREGPGPRPLGQSRNGEEPYVRVSHRDFPPAPLGWAARWNRSRDEPGAGGLPFELQPTSFQVTQDFWRLLQFGEGLELLANVAPVQFAGLPNDDAFHVDPVFGASRKRFHHHQVLR